MHSFTMEGGSKTDGRDVLLLIFVHGFKVHCPRSSSPGIDSADETRGGLPGQLAVADAKCFLGG